MISTLIPLTIALTTASLSSLPPCFQVPEQESEALGITRINNVRSVWAGFESIKTTYGFTDKETGHTILLGIEPSVLDASEVTYTSCRIGEELEAYSLLTTATLPRNGLYDIRMPSAPGTGILGMVVKGSQQVLVQIQQPNAFDFSEHQVARAALHESFHGAYQFSSGKFSMNLEVKPREFIKQCKEVLGWEDSVIKQNFLLNEALSSNDRDTKKRLLLEIQELRYTLALNVDTKECVDSLKFWERIEGSAHYVETEATLKLGLLTYSQFLGEIEPKLLSLELSDGIFYYSGSSLIRLIRDIGVLNWSSLIDKGQMIDDLIP